MANTAVIVLAPPSKVLDAIDDKSNVETPCNHGLLGRLSNICRPAKVINMATPKPSRDTGDHLRLLNPL